MALYVRGTEGDVLDSFFLSGKSRGRANFERTDPSLVSHGPRRKKGSQLASSLKTDKDWEQKSPGDSVRGVIWQGKVHAGPEFRLMILFGSVKIHFYDFKILRGTVLFEKR